MSLSIRPFAFLSLFCLLTITVIGGCSPSTDKIREAGGEASTDDASAEEDGSDTAAAEPSDAAADDKPAEAAPAPAGDTQKVSLAGMDLALPASWNKETPKSRMRLAQYRIGDAADEKNSAEFVAFSFGASGVGDNVRRWVKQYQPEGRTHKVHQGTSKYGPYVIVELSGTENRSVGGPMSGNSRPVPNARTFQVILSPTEGQMVFLKLYGADAVVAAQGDALRAAFGGSKGTEDEIPDADLGL